MSLTPSFTAAVGLCGILLACGFCRQPNIRFFSFITIFNRRKKLTPYGARVYLTSAIVMLLGCMLQALSSGTGSGLPASDATDTQKLLQQAFDGSQFARAENLSLIEASGIKELPGSNRSRRACQAQVGLTNASNAHVTYNMVRHGDNVLLTVHADDIPEDDQGDN
ncbi:hypothetical protein [Caballeronia sp. SBC2]|uniref:hypothetical protein n=1 Tax=Caballeronia sp. SBC2 TaxID=2705547 RepID=UPI0013E13949|nr:hypothetical protein [Caballeronia sp. SBC2]QIE29782.1 hypothetical protein SBC2_78580 [Caballeronia sp. SBC2]